MDKRHAIDHVEWTRRRAAGRTRGSRIVTRVLCIAALLLLALSACTRIDLARTPPEDLPTAALAATDRDDGWWSVAFHVAWDREKSPDWALDTLLADQVCAPALAALRPRIGLWRFHRRAAHDDAGHRFSVLVYTDETTAASLYGRVLSNPMVLWLEDEGHVDGVSLERVAAAGPPAIAESSDANWPTEIQASWPWYIMGVSQTWLALVHQVKAERPVGDLSGDTLLDYYREVNDRVTALWRDYGQHVYLHHLNALFGYAPLVIRETNLKRF